MTFGTWLKARQDHNEAARIIQDFANMQSIADWPYSSDNLSEYIKAVRRHADGDQQEELTDAIAHAYEAFLTDCSYHKQSIRDVLKGIGYAIGKVSRNRPGTVLLTLFGIVFVVFLTKGIFSESFLMRMASPDVARGLITFLFAFTATAIITLVAIAIFWISAEEVESRFSHAKDIIAIVVGVLGTILGFYFGSAGNTDDGTLEGLDSARQVEVLPQSNPQ